MITEAAAKAKALNWPLKLHHGSIFELPADSESFDCALCIRLLNWMSISDVEIALREWSRVSRRSIILGVRMNSPTVTYLDRVLMAAERLQKTYLSKKRNNNKTTVHRQSLIHSLFSKLGLTIQQSTVIDVGLRGTRYELFLLHKANP